MTCQEIIRRGVSCLLFGLLGLAPANGQVNLVPNHSFEEIADCFLEFGDIPKAPPWQVVPEPENSPDLFHYCCTSPFYGLPAGCNQVDPKEGEGMIAQAHNIPSEERVYVRLTDTLPLNVDIYVSFSTIPEAKCGIPPVFLCYTNTQCLAFSDFAFQNLNVILEPDTIISNTVAWSTLRGCYRANGSEDFVLLGNYRLQTEVDCDTIGLGNFAYSYFDEIIVSPFDVIPDTLIICDDETLEIDATFYDLPIRWSDGVRGAIRHISDDGRLIALGDTGRCLLRDTTYIVRIPEEQETIPLAICEGEELLLQAPVSAIWPNGDTSSTFLVTQAGTYQATLLTDCDEKVRSYLYEVAPGACDITYFVPNAFSPNRDGINDQLDFFFASEFTFSGELIILDRWGNLLFQRKVDQSTLPIRWDGTFNGKPLGVGVYVWACQYVSGKDGKTRIVSGDVMVLP
jgi:gliding motility-associated-like protein